jgi:hypothetical protein
MTKEPVFISYEMAVKALDAAVELKGADYHYEKVRGEGGIPVCRYFDRYAKPSCLVGYVFDMLGVDPIPFDDVDNGLGAAAMSNSGRVSYDAATLGLLQEAQVWQDNDKPWGDAVSKAKSSPYRRDCS